MQTTIETIAASLFGDSNDIDESSEALHLAIETGLLTTWLVRSDEVVLGSERRALARALVELFGVSDEVSWEIASAVLSLNDEQLPRRAHLLARVAARAPRDRIRLVEALLAVATADGVLHRNELLLIRRLGEALALPESALRPALARWAPETGSQVLEVSLRDGQVKVGRSADNAVQLPSLSVSRHHARFFLDGDVWKVEDLGSATGTWVDGRRIDSQILNASNLVQVENFCFRFEPDVPRLTLWNENDSLALSVENLTVEVPDRRRGRPRKILDAVSFSCFSGELVAITGPSGSGKTTLAHALLGAVARSGGDVKINGQSCPNLLSRYSRRLGLVPQDDIVHGELTVEEALFFSGALRAVTGVEAEEVRDEVDRVVEELSLQRIRSHRIGDPLHRGVSGGERKRVNLGQELLNPSTEILILDEPTTGLDPHTGLDIFRLLRKLADQGRLVIVVTHRVGEETLGLMDRLIALGTGGRLAFFGSPRDALESSEVSSVPELFDVLRDPRRVERLAERFEQSGHHSLVEDPPAPEDRGRVPPASDSRSSTGRESATDFQRLATEVRQWWRELVLQTLRYGQIKARDRTALLINFGQIPLIVIGCWLVLRETLEVIPVTASPTAAPLSVVPAALPFVLVISAFWLGCVSAIREVVSEQTIYRREKMGGLRSAPYLLSKVLVLSMVAALQCLILVGVTELLFDLRERWMDLGQILLVLFLVSMVGVGLGLLASTVFRTAEAAVAVLPVLVIPQLLFGGVLAPFDEMSVGMRSLSYAMASRWGVNGFVQAGDPGVGPSGFADQEKCTVLVIPGTELQQCAQSFLSSIGLALEGKGSPVPVTSFSMSCFALAGLALGGLLAANLVLAMRR